MFKQAQDGVTLASLQRANDAYYAGDTTHDAADVGISAVDSTPEERMARKNANRSKIPQEGTAKGPRPGSRHRIAKLIVAAGKREAKQGWGSAYGKRDMHSRFNDEPADDALTPGRQQGIKKAAQTRAVKAAHHPNDSTPEQRIARKRANPKKISEAESPKERHQAAKNIVIERIARSGDPHKPPSSKVLTSIAKLR
jgi:hypothetical protein